MVDDIVNIIVLSRKNFISKMKELGFDDSNVEESNDAFISIDGTFEWNGEVNEHYFNDEHDNVLNLNFDDIVEDKLSVMGYDCIGISDEQADEIVEFLYNKLSSEKSPSTIYIHCYAGISRSRAVAEFSSYMSCVMDGVADVTYDESDEYYYKLNRFVYDKLRDALERKYADKLITIENEK